MMRSIFGENLFDDFFGNDLDLFPALPGSKALYGKHVYLSISAAKGLDKDEQDKQGRYIRQERYAGTCSRSFYVGEDVEPSDVSARFEDGILKVSLPKREQERLPQSNRIAIE